MALDFAGVATHLRDSYNHAGSRIRLSQQLQYVGGDEYVER